MKVKSYILFLTSLFIAISCTNDETTMENVYKDYQDALTTANGKRIIELLDENSNIYLKNLHQEIITADSFKISKMKYIDRFNILSARSLISNDSLLQLNTLNLFETLFSNYQFEYKRNLFRDNPILKSTFNGNKCEVELINGLKMVLNKENENWKINLKSIDESKNTVLKKTLGIVKRNKLQANNTNAINTLLLQKISASTTKPFDLLFWPLEMNVDDLYYNYHFSESLACDKNQTWALVTRPKILFFLTDDELNKNFYLKFKNNLEFRKFCKNKYSVVTLTENCFSGRRFFRKFNIKTYPHIIVLNENNDIIQESGGYFITPEMFLANSKKTGVIKYDLTKVSTKERK